MTARMKPPAHCEMCDASSKNMFPLERRADLEEYGVCISCKELTLELLLQEIEAKVIELGELGVDYPPLKDVTSDFKSRLAWALAMERRY